MREEKINGFIGNVIENMPKDWLNLTTHRLDIYDESQAKSQFLERFENLYESNISTQEELSNLPTAFDYIRLGHPLSCVLEWAIARHIGAKADNVLSFSSRTTPILAILRKNLLEGKNTQINYVNTLPDCFCETTIKKIYGYKFELNQVPDMSSVSAYDGTTLFVSDPSDLPSFRPNSNVDFILNTNENLGSIILVNGKDNENYISEIQHVRRRETIAMTPANTLVALNMMIGNTSPADSSDSSSTNKSKVLNSIKEITGSACKAVIASSGLSTQYAIAMGLIHDSMKNHPGKEIKFIVPPNCYGGTNDQARRVAACLDNVEVVDLPVDGDHNMVESIDLVLNKIAKEDAVPLIIAEIPTNPRVEVPDMEKLKDVLSEKRTTESGASAVDPVFILDQTFCPNVHFLGEGEMLSSVRTIAYVSGSKFPSGGKCTAGYCISNQRANELMDKIELHLKICDNEATDLQLEYLAEQMPSMNERIHKAYEYTREFVNFIGETLPDAKINFVSEELAEQGFTPSVFSLDLPTEGNTPEEQEAYKRESNLKLINLMINEIPDESKFCVSYGQLKGCYWTIPATSTQGTTKEGDKDYIVRVALSSQMDLDLHKKVFLDFVNS